ncbi:hypothetical protein UFOVP109_28 [uncultured Caudovirales phage]|uniref:Uncharacterized protein n=1 Tax=uncultured Caudovirales phage TaxID=2100421 RepID=A0A6J5L0B5_9CAUD|nr:hypothetical protein UFOVP109_28 [uncultured Caudovirales phage]CAB5218901.1 hypothetical protein UFOVP224_8 [uncultured Caudovirales phage]
MPEISAEEVALFRGYYDAVISQSRSQYQRNRRAEVNPDNELEVSFTTEIVTGLDVTLMQEKFWQLARDAAEGREARFIREQHPAAQEAYDQYQTILALTRRHQR